MNSSKSDKKYELDLSTKYFDKEHHRTLYRIKALRTIIRDMGDEGNGIVYEGELGGYVESEDNLSQNGSCWIYAKEGAEPDEIAKVFDNARVEDRVSVVGKSILCDSSVALDNAYIKDSILKDHSCVFSRADVRYSELRNNTVIDGFTDVYYAVIDNSEIVGGASVMGMFPAKNPSVHIRDSYINGSIDIGGEHIDIVNSRLTSNMTISGCAEIYDSVIHGEPAVFLPDTNIGSNSPANPVRLMGVCVDKGAWICDGNVTQEKLMSSKVSPNGDSDYIMLNHDGSFTVVVPKEKLVAVSGKNKSILMADTFNVDIDTKDINKDAYQGLKNMFKNVGNLISINIRNNDTPYFVRTNDGKHERKSGKDLALDIMRYTMGFIQKDNREKSAPIVSAVSKKNLERKPDCYVFSAPDFVGGNMNDKISFIIDKDCVTERQDGIGYDVKLLSSEILCSVDGENKGTFLISSSTMADKIENYQRDENKKQNIKDAVIKNVRVDYHDNHPSVSVIENGEYHDYLLFVNPVNVKPAMDSKGLPMFNRYDINLGRSDAQIKALKDYEEIILTAGELADTINGFNAEKTYQKAEPVSDGGVAEKSAEFE